MVSVDEAAEMAVELPEVTEGARHGNRTWSVGGEVFAWDRAFSKADIRRFGDATPPDGPILAVRVAERPPSRWPARRRSHPGPDSAT